MYGVQRMLLILFYLISVISLSWLLFYVLNDLLKLSGVIILMSSLVYFVLVVILYGFIHVTSYIPANLAGAFDPLKNDIAGRKISSGKELAERLAEFMTTFFNFAFFDVECALVRIQDDTSKYPGEFFEGELDLDLDNLEQKSRESDGTFYMGKIKAGSGYFHLYGTPLMFGDIWLGYIAVFSRRRLWKIFRNLLAEFENDYIDDQVVHVLEVKPGQGTITK